MSKDEKEISRVLVQYFGGLENLKSLSCCTTRLKVQPQDVWMVQKHEIEKLPEVLGCWEKNDEIQVFMGVYVCQIHECIVKLIEQKSDHSGMNNEKSKSSMTPLLRNEHIGSPLKGSIVQLENCSKSMIETKKTDSQVTIVSSEVTLVSPVTGVITMIYYSEYAIELRTESGIKVCLHISSDLYEGFELFSKLQIQIGHRVTQGQILLHR
ncbi:MULTISPECIES: PTS glucose transporter subunit IIA [Paenibacillus]|uniref:PTS glucose transporter subunit IIA n=1 Tax=Paenibacillus TaxID=44249 RepID=UPI000464AC10|nr:MULTISPECIES: PTS glucose transporter subunit IIA [Paenibacillus]KGP77714.1 hypothetical protein P364_0132090 [Paenibacillus sp. MAEPY2]KGP77968.1 hypothetical protein P363_0132710 [Paenibacillus sp. MAEPY1]OZQ62845.1 hypothetical protein CA599_25555 [Paenibacillus taichungensis]